MQKVMFVCKGSCHCCYCATTISPSSSSDKDSSGCGGDPLCMRPSGIFGQLPSCYATPHDTMQCSLTNC